ncbi:MAG: AI-2E family transporter [Proteobacteria bacterium]|nr:AI-2E family transporter [Pseudomonadota bacterium]
MLNKRQASFRWLWGLGAAALFLIVAWRLENLAILFLLSFLVAYVLNPLVTRLERLRFVNRTSATLITLFGLLVGFLAVLFIIVPEVVNEFRHFLSRMPAQLDRLQSFVVPWIERNFDVDIPLSVGDAFDQFRREINEIAPKVIGPATEIVARIFGGTFSAVFAVVSALMFPLFLFFLLKDYPSLLATADGYIPRQNLDRFHQIGREVDESLSAFLHGQFMVMLVLGTLYSIGYSVVGIPVAIGVGLLTGMLCFIPYVGAATGFVLALILSLLDFDGFGTVFGVIIIFSIVQLLDGTVITPRILGGKLGLRPLWIIVALMAGAELFGFLGVLLAVPTIAVLKVLMSHMIEFYKSSNLYRITDESSSDHTPDKGSDVKPREVEAPSTNNDK